MAALGVREADIEENEVESVPGHQVAGAGESLGGGDIVALLAQLLLQVAADDGVVLQNDDFFNGHGWAQS